MKLGELLKYLGIALGSMSMVLMAANGLDLTFGPNATRVLELAAFAFGFFGPLVDFAQPIVDRIRELIQPVPDLQPHWHYVFALTGLYFFKNVPQFWASAYDTSLPPNTRRNCGIMAIVSAVLGVLVAFFVSVICGLIPLQGPTGNLKLLSISLPGEVLFVTAPIIGFFVYTILLAFFEVALHRDVIAIKLDKPVEPAIPFLLRRTKNAALVSGAGLAIALILLSLDWVQSFSSPPLFVMAVVMIALAAYWLVRASTQARGSWARMRTLGNYALGLDMLAVVFWSIVLYAILYGVG